MHLSYGTIRASSPATGTPGHHHLHESGDDQGSNIWGP